MRKLRILKSKRKEERRQARIMRLAPLAKYRRHITVEGSLFILSFAPGLIGAISLTLFIIILLTNILAMSRLIPSRWT